MKIAIGLAAILAAISLAACDQPASVTTSAGGHTVTSRPDNPDVISYGDGDKVMNAAIADAQAHLSYFWEHVASPAQSEKSFSLKVAFPVVKGDASGREHVWVSDFEKTSSGYSGLLANEPLDMVGKKLGDRVEFTPDMISDWGFLRDGKMIGYYTTRVSLDDGDPAEVAAIRAMLGDNPK